MARPTDREAAAAVVRVGGASGELSVDAQDVSVVVGRRVAEYRRLRGLKVAQLARRIGVTGSLISQIERGRARPSISTLFLLGEALGVPMDAFFRSERQRVQAGSDRVGGLSGAGGEAGVVARRASAFSGAPGLGVPGGSSERFVVRADERATLEIAGGVRWERLTAETLEEGEFLEAVYAPHSESSAELYRHPGSEWVLVFQGTLEITVGFTSYELRPGDSMCFPSSLPHRYANRTDETVRAISVNLWDLHARMLADPNAPRDH